MKMISRENNNIVIDFADVKIDKVCDNRLQFVGGASIELGGKWMLRSELREMPYAKAFDVYDKRTQTLNHQLCNATGTEVYINGEWWNEYEDSFGGLHYGR